MKKGLLTCLKSFLLIATISIGLNANSQGLNELKTGLEHYQRNHLIEKLFVHVNKDFYLTGEILWFKIYNVEGARHVPLDMSKVAYLELLDDKHTPILQTKIMLKNGQGNGSVYLPPSIASGNYLLRSYTNWMKNFSADNFFEQKIKIINLSQPLQPVTQQQGDDYDIQFMPEGGNLVQGLISKVAVKVTGKDGLGLNYIGAIVDQKNDTLTRFVPLKMGIGSFNFTPVSGQNYKAVIKINGKNINKSLPAISASGYVMRADNKGSAWDITINKTPGTNNNLYLLIHNTATVVAAAEVNFNNDTYHYNINNAQLKDGINIVTLFNAQRQPVCERLLFKRPENQLKIAAITDAKSYSQRQKVTLAVNTTNESNNANPASASLSVYRLDSMQKATELNIGNYLWLSSEIKGEIESPDYYFSSNSADVNQALDNLLLAQGWRSFNWTLTNIGTKYTFNFLPEYEGNIVAAKVTNKSTGLPAKKITAYLTARGEYEKLYTSVPDSAGRLLFNIENMYGNHEMIFQANHFIDSTFYNFEIESPFTAKYSSTQLPALADLNYHKNSLAETGLSMQVQNAYHAMDMRKFTTPYIDTIPFYRKEDIRFLLDNYTRFTTMEEVMREFITYIVVTNRQGKLYVKEFDTHERETNHLISDDPLVTIDGMPLFDNNKLFSIDPLKVKTVNVLPQNYFIGPAKFEGLLMLSSIAGDMAKIELDPHAIVLDYEALQQQRQFYSPVYENQSDRSSRLPDYRSALYWNPNIISDNNGSSNINFYTSDIPGKYIGIIQGITNDGKTGTSSFTFDVK